MPAYAATVFLGAFLLFQAQPLIAKYILPWFGGVPAVWTTCLLFFQAMLLGGYVYAHLCSRRLKPRAQVICHLVLIGLALATLPITPSASWKPDGRGNPTLQILGILTACLGLPYFVLASTGPLMQHWFSRTRTGAAPYRLYALSNAGSLLALLSFPVWFEPRYARQVQAGFWGWGLAAYGVACCFCAVQVWRAPAAGAPDGKTESPTQAARGFNVDRLLWWLLPACASVLLLATTNKICQEVAVIPFLWVLPLSLYLLSFIVSFDSPRWYVRSLFVPALAGSWIAWLFFLKPTTPVSVQLIVYSAGLFVGCMVCHGELCRLKPASRDLTLFYLFIAGGGALGGLFVAVLAPLLFRDYFELQSGIFLSGLLSGLICLRDWKRNKKWRWRWLAAAGAVLTFATSGLVVWQRLEDSEGSSVAGTRNFYGTLTVSIAEMRGPAERLRMLVHGATLHGTQFTDAPRAAWPTLYYGEGSGVGLALQALTGEKRNIGMVGLGVGTVAAYGRAGDHFYIYEINPDVLRLANAFFTYLSNCPATLETTLGDARLALESSPARNFDLLVLDAFSSDAIPVHLMTREAFLIYERHMKTNGVIAVHITNRSLDLEPVVVGIAREFNYRMAIVEQAAPPEKWWRAENIWVLLSRSGEVVESHPVRVAARPVRTDRGGVRLWTDDFTSLFAILRARALRVDAGFEEAQFQNARSLGLRGDFPGAAATFQAALRGHPDSSGLHNNLAFLLATCPDARVRNAPQAVTHAQRACELTGYKQAVLVSTLAIVYSEAGRFDDAVLAAEKAGALASDAGDRPLADQNQELLEFYRRKKSYLEAVAARQNQK